jgi:hypothetical protein
VNSLYEAGYYAVFFAYRQILIDAIRRRPGSLGLAVLSL